MKHNRKKLMIAGVVLVLAVAYLGFAGARKGWVYYLQVDQFVGSSEYANQRVKLCGKVGTENCIANRGSMMASFTLDGQSKHLPVVYHGVIPDLFQAGHEVVVEGKLDGAGVFQADVLLTKCASKYQAEGHPGAGGPGKVADGATTPGAQNPTADAVPAAVAK